MFGPEGNNLSQFANVALLYKGIIGEDFMSKYNKVPLYFFFFNIVNYELKALQSLLVKRPFLSKLFLVDFIFPKLIINDDIQKRSRNFYEPIYEPMVNVRQLQLFYF